MSKPLQLFLVVVAGLVSARFYAQWLLASDAHKEALHSAGVAGYWLWLGGPALILFAVFALVATRPPVSRFAARVVGSALAAVAVWFLGFFSSYLLCVFVTRGVCE